MALSKYTYSPRIIAIQAHSTYRSTVVHLFQSLVSESCWMIQFSVEWSSPAHLGRQLDLGSGHSKTPVVNLCRYSACGYSPMMCYCVFVLVLFQRSYLI